MQTYEKYLPRGVLKPLPDASFEEREAWIRAKYEYKVSSRARHLAGRSVGITEYVPIMRSDCHPRAVTVYLSCREM